MKSCVLHSTAKIESDPLELDEVEAPAPVGDQILVRVSACGVCRTDLHVIEAELPQRKMPVIPGHQVVGIVEKVGDRVTRFKPGARVGIAWLHKTCGKCEYCRAGKENLCDNAAFTGYTVDGGYAEYALASEQFTYAIPEAGSASEVRVLCVPLRLFVRHSLSIIKYIIDMILCNCRLNNNSRN